MTDDDADSHSVTVAGSGKAAYSHSGRQNQILGGHSHYWSPFPLSFMLRRISLIMLIAAIVLAVMSSNVCAHSESESELHSHAEANPIMSQHHHSSQATDTSRPAPFVPLHGDEEHGDADADGNTTDTSGGHSHHIDATTSALAAQVETHWSPLIIAHAILLTAAFAFILPIGVILALRGSHKHKWVQSVGVGLVIVAVILAIIDISIQIGKADTGEIAAADEDEEVHAHHVNIGGLKMSLSLSLPFIEFHGGHHHGPGDEHTHAGSLHAKLGFTTFSLFIVQGLMGWAMKVMKMTHARAQRDGPLAMAMASGKLSPHDPVHQQSTGAIADLEAQERTVRDGQQGGDARGNENASIPDSRSFHLLRFLHGLFAVLGMLILAPLTMAVGIITAAGLLTNPNDADNLAAHVGFGAGLAVGGLASTSVSVGALPFPRYLSLPLFEYMTWAAFGVIIILSQHDWPEPLASTGMDVQHVVIGVYALVASTCGMVLLGIARYNIKKQVDEYRWKRQVEQGAATHQLDEDEHEDEAVRKPLLFTPMDKTHSAYPSHDSSRKLCMRLVPPSRAPSTWVLLSRIPSFVLYVSLGAALWGHQNGVEYNGTLHAAFGIYCVLIAITKLICLPNQVVLEKAANGEEEEEKETMNGEEEEEDIKREMQMQRIDQQNAMAMKEKAVNETIPTATPVAVPSATPMKEATSTPQADLHKVEEKDDHGLSGTPPAPGVPSSSSSSSSSPATLRSTTPPGPVKHRDAPSSPPPLSLRGYEIAWNDPSGIESVGRYQLLTFFLLVLTGTTFSGSSKWGQAAAAGHMEVIPYLCILAGIATAIFTWWLSLIQGIVAAKEEKMRKARMTVRMRMRMMHHSSMKQKYIQHEPPIIQEGVRV